MAGLKLVVGLGNPGRDYHGTRHNIGFAILDEIAEELRGRFELEKKWEGEVMKAGGVTFLKPMTYMNLSGRSVASLARFYRWSAEEILVVYDDVNLGLGALRFRESGSDGGHNGIKSLIEHLGTRDFPRLRVGVGGAAPGELVGHVLGQFAPDEREEMQNTLARARTAVQLAASQGVILAANEFNVREKPKKQESSDDEQKIRRSDSVEHQGE